MPKFLDGKTQALLLDDAKVRLVRARNGMEVAHMGRSPSVFINQSTECAFRWRHAEFEDTLAHVQERIADVEFISSPHHTEAARAIVNRVLATICSREEMILGVAATRIKEEPTEEGVNAYYGTESAATGEVLALLKCFREIVLKLNADGIVAFGDTHVLMEFASTLREQRELSKRLEKASRN